MLRRPGLLARDRRAALAARYRPVAVERHLVGEGLRLRGHGPQPTLAPMALAILGVTGFTGRLVLDEARRAGLDVRLVGRRREALEELAKSGEEVRVADARDEEALQAAFAGASVVASLAGPFLELGLAPPRAAAAAGAHYLDSSGEQEWVRLLHDELEAETAVPACVRLRLRPRRSRRPAGGRAGRGTARRDRRRLFGQGCRHEPGHAADDRPRDGPGAGRVGGRAPRPLSLRRDFAHRALPVRRPQGRRVGR